jgi:hypothetical protein
VGPIRSATDVSSGHGSKMSGSSDRRPRKGAAPLPILSSTGTHSIRRQFGRQGLGKRSLLLYRSVRNGQCDRTSRDCRS